MKHYKILLIPSLKQLWILVTVHYYAAELNSKTNITILTLALPRTILPCLLFGKSDAKEKTFINPVTDWSNISGYFKRHEKSDSSHYKFFEMADNFLQITSDSKPSISVSLESFCLWINRACEMIM
jgi:hypothetical protein